MGEVRRGVLRCGVGEERSGERCKGGFRGCGKVWKEMRGDVGGSKVWEEVRKMWAVGEGKGRCGKKYGGCREVWRKCEKSWGRCAGVRGSVVKGERERG